MPDARQTRREPRHPLRPLLLTFRISLPPHLPFTHHTGAWKRQSRHTFRATGPQKAARYPIARAIRRLVCFLHFNAARRWNLPMMMNTDATHRLLLDNLNTAIVLLNDSLRLEYMNPA